MSIRTLIFSLLLAAPVAGLEIGAAMPAADVSMRSVDGKSVSLAQVAGQQGTLVVFTCNHCPWAKAWQERIAALGNAYAKRGIGVIAVNANDPSEHKEDGYDEMVARAKTLGLQFPYVVDGHSSVARAFGAERTPEAFLFNAKGTLVYHGTIDDNAEEADAVKVHYLRDALEAVATNASVPLSQTKALGCSIKFYES